MATLKQRLYKKNQQDEGYDLVHLETSADIITMADSSTKVSDMLINMHTAANVLPTDPYLLDVDNLAVGTVISWAGYDWRIVNKDSLYMYMITKDVIFKYVTFGSTNKYASSNVAKIAQQIEEQLPTAAVKHLGTMTVRDVKARVYIPEDFWLGYNNTWFRGYSYFGTGKIDTRRIAYYDGAAVSYWTSSTGGTGSDVVDVRSDGSFYINANPSSSSGFRPCVAYKR